MSEFTGMKLGALADLRYDLQQERKEAASFVEGLKKRERELDDFILTQFDEEEMESAKGKKASITKQRTTIATVTDWEAFHKYIAQNNAFELMQKRAAVTALRERWDDNTEIPGVEAGRKVSVSVRKAG